MVKCIRGEEKSAALLLMRKSLAFSNTDNPLQIKSVVVPEYAKGFIYVEAFKVSHVIKAIENIGSLKYGIWQIPMVPINEMTDVLKVIRKAVELKPKQWVRVKRGLYKNDIAQVLTVNLAQNLVNLKLFPRIDYNKLRGSLKEKKRSIIKEAESSVIKPKNKAMLRPKAKLFNVSAVEEIGGHITKDKEFFVFEGNQYSPKGLLHKAFLLPVISADNVQPTLGELDAFDEDSEGDLF